MLFSKNHHINNISTIIIVFISILITIKTPFKLFHSELITISIFILLVIISFYYIEKFIDNNKNPSAQAIDKKIKNNFTLIISIIVVILSTLFSSLKTTNNINEVNLWLNNYANGIFPYENNTTNSHLPFFYILLLPFYLIKQLRLFIILGFILILIENSNLSKTNKEFFAKIILLLLTPIFYYSFYNLEIEITLAILFISLFIIANNNLIEININNKSIIMALFTGLILSTELIFIYPFLIFLFFYFRNNLKNGLFFLLITFISFVLFNLPFIIWNDLFFFHSKFINSQFLYLPLWLIIILFLITIYVGWMISDFQELLFSSGIILFVISSLSFFYQPFDLSLYLLSFPFLLISIREYKVDYYLGKIIS
ncbi:MAG: hypothetical protein STSR0008_13440 [Ignavibacterium sp.]